MKSLRKANKNWAITSESIDDDRRVLGLIASVRDGIIYADFSVLAESIPFSTNEWANYLHISSRSLQRYKSENKTFDPIHAERIFQIGHLFELGLSIFEDAESLNIWLKTKNISLGGIVPKTLLDTSYGIGMLKDELIRIEHGIFA